MADNRHETFEDYHEVKTSSDRAFGLTVGGILIAIAAVRAWFFDAAPTTTALIAGPGALLVGLGLIWAKALAPLNLIWTKLGQLLAKIVNPIIMALMYFLMFVPIGLVMKIAGRDVLQQKPKPDAATYWVDRDPAGPPPDSMPNQF